MYNLGQYIHGDAFTYRLDPRTKLLSVMALSLLVFNATLSSGFLISLLIVAIALVSRLSIHQLFDAIKPLAVIMALLFFVHVLFTDGTTLTTLPLIHVRLTYEGLYQGAFVVWQIVCLVLTAAVLTMTTAPSALVSGIEKLLRPLKVIGISSHDLAVMISTALRFMPTLLEEFDRLRTAQTARGADIKTGSMAEKARWTKDIAIPLTISVFRRADDLSDAMEARGYQRGSNATLSDLRFTSLDIAAVAVMLAFTGVFFMLTGMTK